MPVYVFTYHAYRSWMPDNPRGYVKRHKGILAPDEGEADRYRSAARHGEFAFSEDVQRLLIDEARRACGFQTLRLHLVATEPTHVHVLVSWTGDKTWTQARTSLKQSFTRALRAPMRASDHDADRPFFSDGASRRRLRNRRHFDHWMNEYGPSHSGWKWREDRGAWK